MEPATAEVSTTAAAPIVMVSAGGLLVNGVQTKNLHLAEQDELARMASRRASASGPTWAILPRELAHAVALYFAILCFVTGMIASLGTIAIEPGSLSDRRR